MTLLKTTNVFCTCRSSEPTYKDILGLTCYFIPAWICNASQITVMVGLGWSILKYGISIFVRHIGFKKIPETDTVLANFVTIKIINVNIVLIFLTYNIYVPIFKYISLKPNFFDLVCINMAFRQEWIVTGIRSIGVVLYIHYHRTYASSQWPYGEPCQSFHHQLFVCNNFRK